MPKLRWLTIPAFSFLGFVTFTSSAGAQSFVEFAAGSSVHPGVNGAGASYGHSLTGRASFGQPVRPGLSIRLDADFTQFDNTVQFYPPCAPPGCTHPSYYTQSTFLAGLSVNALANLDSKGVFYVVGGGGLGVGGDDVDTGLQLRMSGGVGVAIPAGRLRIVAEARCLGLIGATPNGSWLIPLTVGIRY